MYLTPFELISRPRRIRNISWFHQQMLISCRHTENLFASSEILEAGNRKTVNFKNRFLNHDQYAKSTYFELNTRLFEPNYRYIRENNLLCSRFNIERRTKAEKSKSDSYFA